MRVKEATSAKFAFENWPAEEILEAVDKAVEKIDDDSVAVTDA